MRRLLPGLLLFLLIATPVGAGGLDSGGGVRGNGQVTVHDALGVPLAGFSQSAQVLVSSGSLFGLAFPTPVMLLSLEIGVVADGVALSWEGSDDRGLVWFRVERSEGASEAGGSTPEVRGDLFTGPGPHRYLDRDVIPGAAYRYQLRARLRTGEEELLGPWTVTAAGQTAPPGIAILAASPNPFRDAFSLSYSLPAPAPVSWRILDVRGALVEAGDLGSRPAGAHRTAVRPPAGLPRGIYFLEVRAGSVREVQKVVKLP